MNSIDLRALPASDLVALIARGDHRAFGELYDRYAARVLGLSTRLILNRAIAEEVAQEVFLELWQSSARFEPGKGGVTGWILSITRLRTIDRIRSEQASHERMVKAGIREIQPDQNPFDDVVENAATKLAALTALRTLTQMQREAVSLYYSGYTYPELARSLSVPVGTAKSRVHDGMVKLRSQVAAAGSDRPGSFDALAKTTTGVSAQRNSERLLVREC